MPRLASRTESRQLLGLLWLLMRLAVTAVLIWHGRMHTTRSAGAAFLGVHGHGVFLLKAELGSALPA
ncbi:hypothetical protein ACFV3E_41195 [Streptomyces sp. NPDC059718]